MFDNIPLVIGALVVTALLYGLMWTVFFSKDFHDRNFANWPKWLKVLAVVFAPVTMLCYIATGVVALVLTLYVILSMIVTGDAWRSWQDSRAARKAVFQEPHDSRRP